MGTAKKIQGKKSLGGARPARIALIVLACFVLFAAYKFFGPNTGAFSEGEYLYIHTGSNYEQVKATLHQGGFVSDIRSFDLLAKQLHYPDHVHAGKYRISRGMSNYSMIRLLHSGRQTPVKLVINKLRTRQDFINIVCQNLEADSAVLKQMLHDPVYLAQFGFDTNTVMCAVMPDTYDFFWNTTADNAFRKIEKSYIRFWTDDKKQAAENQNLTPSEAIIIASIVDEESNKNTEKPVIASVYLNRLHTGMKLQADPTVRYALGDFKIKRILGEYLKIASPYNTYYTAGLPPGPICTPAPASIDAVLNAPKTAYLYFCAKEDFSGYHNFAVTYAEQLQNARRYQQALNDRKIYK